MGRSDEHESNYEVVIKATQPKLYPEGEFKPQIQHSKLMFIYFEEEMIYLEEWMTKDTSDEDCIKVAYLI